MTKNLNRVKIITFRVTQDEYARIENAALEADDEPNNWCRKVALDSASKEQFFSVENRVLYTEIACLHFLFGHAFRLIFGANREKETNWHYLTKYADEQAETMYHDLLKRRLRRSQR